MINYLLKPASKFNSDIKAPCLEAFDMVGLCFWNDGHVCERIFVSFYITDSNDTIKRKWWHLSVVLSWKYKLFYLQRDTGSLIQCALWLEILEWTQSRLVLNDNNNKEGLVLSPPVTHQSVWWIPVRTHEDYYFWACSSLQVITIDGLKSTCCDCTSARSREAVRAARRHMCPRSQILFCQWCCHDCTPNGLIYCAFFQVRGLMLHSH